jgi:hypothetical protein
VPSLDDWEKDWQVNPQRAVQAVCRRWLHLQLINIFITHQLLAFYQ